MLAKNGGTSVSRSTENSISKTEGTQNYLMVREREIVGKSILGKGYGKEHKNNCMKEKADFAVSPKFIVCALFSFSQSLNRDGPLYFLFVK